MNYRNVVANFFGRTWAILILLILTPFYIEKLGFEAYGLIGFFAIVQSVTALLEAGFPLAINKTCAQFSAQEISSEEVSIVLKGFERLFMCASLILCFLAIPLSFLLTSYWFEFEGLKDNDVISGVICIFFLTAIRFPIGLYLGVLAGLQKQVRVNLLSVIFTSLRLGGAALVLLLWPPDILNFFMVQIFVAFAEVLFTREISWRAHINFRKSIPLSWNLVRKHASFAAGVGILTLLGVVLLQFDKIFVSGMLPISDFGIYSLIAMIGAGISTLGYPVATASFPQFVKLISEKSEVELRRSYYSYFRLVSMIVVPISASVACYHHKLLEFYTGNVSLGVPTANAFYIFILASVFSAMRPVSYGLLLALNKQKIVINYYLGLLVAYPILIVVFTEHLGINGAALAFLIMQLISICVFLAFGLKALDENNIVFRVMRLFLLPVGVCFLVASTFTEMSALRSSELHVVLKVIITYPPTVLALLLVLYTRSELISGTGFVRKFLRGV